MTSAWLLAPLLSLGPTPPLVHSEQLVVVLTDDWDAPRGMLYPLSRQGGRWVLWGKPRPAWVGRSGLGWRSDPGSPKPPAPGPLKQEGDGRAPAGLLTFDELWGYADKAPDHVALPYHKAGPLDRCVDDVKSPDYNRLVKERPDSTWQSAESLRMPTDHYKYLVVLGYNRSQPRPGAGSCIFFHVAPPPEQPTAGCTALPEASLLEILRWLAPAKHPRLLQLPRAVLPQVIRAWQLPPELATLPGPASLPH